MLDIDILVGEVRALLTVLSHFSVRYHFFDANALHSSFAHGCSFTVGLAILPFFFALRTLSDTIQTLSSRIEKIVIQDYGFLLRTFISLRKIRNSIVRIIQMSSDMCE